MKCQDRLKLTRNVRGLWKDESRVRGMWMDETRILLCTCEQSISLVVVMDFVCVCLYLCEPFN
jgi:hypothetical protein